MLLNNHNWFNDHIKFLIKTKNKNYIRWKKYGHIYPNLNNIYQYSKTCVLEPLDRLKINSFTINLLLVKMIPSLSGKSLILFFKTSQILSLYLIFYIIIKDNSTEGLLKVLIRILLAKAI